MSTKNILEFNRKEARNFFLKSESYCNLELPEYIDMGQMVRGFLYSVLNGNISWDKIKKDGVSPKDLSDVNYILFTNKDAHYEWRKFQFIHPIFYLLLVDLITQEENWDFIVIVLGCIKEMLIFTQ